MYLKYMKVSLFELFHHIKIFWDAPVRTYLDINLYIFCYMNIWTYKTSKEETEYLLVN